MSLSHGRERSLITARDVVRGRVVNVSTYILWYRHLSLFLRSLIGLSHQLLLWILSLEELRRRSVFLLKLLRNNVLLLRLRGFGDVRNVQLRLVSLCIIALRFLVLDIDILF